MRRCLHTFRAAGWAARAVVAVAVVAAALAVSCTDDTYDNSPDEPLKLSVSSVTVDKESRTITVAVTARDADWSVEGVPSWCTVIPDSGERGVTRIALNFAANAAAEGETLEKRYATLVFSSAGTTKELAVEQLNSAIVLPNEHADKAINEEVYAELGKWYYNGEPALPDDIADFNQSYRDFYSNYLGSLKYNTLEVYEWARDNNTRNRKYTRSYIERNPKGTAVTDIVPLNYGMEFDLNEFDGKMVGRVLYVEPGSPAARAGLERGQWFYKVNETQLGSWTTEVGDFGYHYNRFIDTLVHPIRDISPTLGMITFVASPPQRLVDQGRTVTLTPEEWSSSPIFATQIIEEQRVPAAGGELTYTGYMMYNRFDSEYEGELVTAFRDLFSNRPAGRELQNFILDVRYNKSGSVEMAELLGNLLVGNVEGVAGQTFADYKFYNQSTVAAPYSRKALFERHEYGIAADTVFVLTSPSTAGASELLINALRGLDQSTVKLVVIGEMTQGLAAGMVKRTVSLDDEWEYSAWMLAFSCGDYRYGLVPNGGEVSEWQAGDNLKWSTSWGWKGQVGSTEDPLVKRAMDMIRGRELLPTANVINASTRNRPGYRREFCFPTNMMMDITENE